MTRQWDTEGVSLVPKAWELPRLCKSYAQLTALPGKVNEKATIRRQYNRISYPALDE